MEQFSKLLLIHFCYSYISAQATSEPHLSRTYIAVNNFLFLFFEFDRFIEGTILEAFIVF